MTLQLRDYQDDLIAEARGHIRAGIKSILVQSPTGSGKTVLVAKMLQTAASRGYACWFNVHRRELVKQSVLTLADSAGLDVGVVASGFQGNRHLPIQVCSIGTLRNRRRLMPDPTLIIWDECHHLAAKSWAEIFAAYPAAVHIGLTATPERLDGTGLDKWFSVMVKGPTVESLIEQGYLSPYRMFAPATPDLSGVHILGGDYNKKELAAAMESSSVTGDVVSHYRKHAAGKRMVLFAWSVEASMTMAEKFRAAGVPAEHVDGDTDSAMRDAIIEDFRAGRTLVMCNVDLFGEGFDVPAIEAVALLRPTQSLTVYLQQVGRALRPAPGKEYAIILDHAGNCRRFGLPDDPRDWTLAGRKKGRTADNAAPIRQCPKCYAVMSAAADSCKYCGHKFEAMPREIEQVEGELHEIDVKRIEREERLREQGQARGLDDLLKIAKLRGYKNPDKWAHAVFASRQAKMMAREAARLIKTGTLI